MTNSLNTPIEALEYAYPFRVCRYALRRGSGGAGRYRGGDGIIREMEVLADAQVAVLADRRKFPPYGLAGGQPGRSGVNRLFPPPGYGRAETLPSKFMRYVKRGTVVSIETPGGGGWGSP
jgi:N-methylhydantoinase B